HSVRQVSLSAKSHERVQQRRQISPLGRFADIRYIRRVAARIVAPEYRKSRGIHNRAKDRRVYAVGNDVNAIEGDSVESMHVLPAVLAHCRDAGRSPGTQRVRDARFREYPTTERLRIALVRSVMYEKGRAPSHHGTHVRRTEKQVSPPVRARKHDLLPKRRSQPAWSNDVRCYRREADLVRDRSRRIDPNLVKRLIELAHAPQQRLDHARYA